MRATFFVAAAVTASAALTLTATEISMIAPAFAQGDNMTGGGNATDGNMTAGSDMAGSGMATPSIMTP